MDRNALTSKPLSALTGLWRASTDWIIPGQSLASLEPVGWGAAFRPQEFGDTEFLRPPYCACCAYPFDQDEGTRALCASCLAEPPLYGHLRAPFIYGDVVRDMVLHLKRQGRRSGLKLYANLMYDAARDIIDTCDLLIPVPLHTKRLASRGFNQSGWLATALGKVSGAPVRHDLLDRHKSSPSQGHLSPLQRQKNVSGAFSVPDRHKPEMSGKRIVLIDDVFTTGATIRACSKTILKAKAAHVDVVTLARVVTPAKPTI